MTFYVTKYKGIEKKEYDIEVITPMLLGGAHPRKPELRSAPFKGMLRYWWRALHVNLVKNNDFRTLKTEESKLFGDAGEKSGKSSVIIQIDRTNGYKDVKQDDYNPLPHKVNNKFKIRGIAPGGHFKIILSAPESVHSLFKLMVLLGGFGKRSRRGFGSIKIKGCDISELDDIYKLINSVNNANIYELIDNKIKIKGNYNANYPYLQTVELNKGNKDNKKYEDLLKRIGEASHKYNSDYTGFAKNKKRFSSPVYVSIIKSNGSFIPIISTLNAAFESSYKPAENSGVDKFKKHILYGSENDLAKT